jgi:hypothetical protein
MATSPALHSRTRILARILGPYLVIVPLIAVARAPLMTDIVADFTASPAWSWVTGAFVLLAGLAVIAVHPYWKGAAAVVVSVTGWLMVVKGFFLLAFSQSYLESAANAIGVGAVWRTIELIAAGVGLYLTYAGWAPTRHPTAPASGSTQDLPRAA